MMGVTRQQRGRSNAVQHAFRTIQVLSLIGLAVYVYDLSWDIVIHALDVLVHAAGRLP